MATTRNPADCKRRYANNSSVISAMAEAYETSCEIAIKLAVTVYMRNVTIEARVALNASHPRT